MQKINNNEHLGNQLSKLRGKTGSGYKNNFAFTLAEVLITLGIIGVVAAITIPSLMTKLSDIRNAAILKEDYSILQQVMRRAYNDGADATIAGDNAVVMKKWYETYFQPYMTVAHVCFGTKGCWSEQKSKYLNGGNWADANKDGLGVGIGHNPLCFVLSNGSNICIDDFGRPEQVWDALGVRTSGAAMALYIDVNGNKAPNMLGKDIFVAASSEDHFVPAGNSKTREEISKDCSKTGKGMYCLWVVKNSGWAFPKFK